MQSNPLAQTDGASLGTSVSGTPKIVVRDLYKAFDVRRRRIVAIDRVSLDIATGEFFTIVGPSGCGKTTLLRILAGLDTPTSGEARIERSGGDRPGNAMVFQGESIFPWMTVFENAAYDQDLLHDTVTPSLR